MRITVTKPPMFLQGYGKKSRHLFLIPIILIVLFTGYRGIDVGIHEDERFTITSVYNSMENGRLLPTYYYYPSMIYNFGLARMIPEAFKTIIKQISGPLDVSVSKKQDIRGVVKSSAGIIGNKLYNYARSHQYKLQLRSLLLFFSLLTIVWVYFIVFIWRNSWTEALLGAAILSSSWEVAYHSRLIIPDPLLMQFAVLTILFIMISVLLQKRATSYLILAALFAGLSTGTKYTGGILLLPILITYVYHQIQNDQTKFYHLIIILFVFSAAFLISTPGSLIDPIKFTQGILYEIRHYKYGLNMNPSIPGFSNYKIGHGPNSVDPGFEHLYLSLSYLFLVAFSKYWPISIMLSILTLFGLYDLIRREKLLGVIFTIVPLFWVGYMGLQRVLFIRNYLTVLPFMAILSARGFTVIKDYFRNKAWKCLLVSIVFSMILINYSWLFYSSSLIIQRNQLKQNVKLDELAQDYDYPWPGKWKYSISQNIHEKDLIQYIQKYRYRRMYLSAEVAKLLQVKQRRVNFSNLVTNPNQADEVLFYTFEINNPHDSSGTPKSDNQSFWVANKFDFYKVVSGSYEININYLPTWSGDPWILSLDVNNAKKTLLVEFGTFF
jgi:hypothetical protein